jgi:dihydrodipicolinate synthase/N-acetylneuraminate lyase
MSENMSIAASRAELLGRLFPDGIPRLWCPSLTHYDADGALDAARIAAHLQHLAPHVRGFLIPGSTGDGWELSDAEISRLIAFAGEQARRLKLHVLIGALKKDAAAALRAIRDTMRALGFEKGKEPPWVSGFTVCAPSGKELTQAEIAQGLESILEAGLPTAIYQLPQVTQNEFSPELARGLAARFHNFILFKDTSGTDRVALSENSWDGVFLVRGAEGNYARWLKTAQGPYDGFLLSTANCFAAEFAQIMSDIGDGRLEAAQAMSQRLTAAVNQVFELAAGLPAGNAFTNANKAMDHFFAFGPRAAGLTPPRIHAGVRLPVEAIRATGEILTRNGLMPRAGYLE